MPNTANPTDARPPFLITIDTEGDNLWARPRAISTRNTAFLPRFQAICERYGFLPTWLTNYEMAMDPAYVEFGRDVIRRSAGEIGMHLHAWNSPPLTPLTEDDFQHQPFLFEYPRPLLVEKIRYVTDLLRTSFDTEMISHRAGRWGFDANYAQGLVEAGYRVDCSVTPLRSWRSTIGDPRQRGGPDYTDFPRDPYFVDLHDISRPGRSELLEAPMTVRKASHQTDNEQSASRNKTYWSRFKSWSRSRRNERRGKKVEWLRPRGDNVEAMLSLVSDLRAECAPYAMFMLHSSEMMPGGSPTFLDASSIERLYDDLERLFEHAGKFFVGATLASYRALFAKSSTPMTSGPTTDAQLPLSQIV
jgi:hypothetical protein